MKRYEQIVLLILCICFGIQFIGSSNKGSYLLFSTCLLSFSYLVGGYWLLNLTEPKRIFLPILAGIALAISLYSLPFSIWLDREPYYNFLPLVNGLLFTYLLIQSFLIKKPEGNFRNNKPILIRSGIILMVTAFFAYTPISFKPYWHIVYLINNGHVELQNNILMHSYIEEYRDALENGDCEEAIGYALKANQAGKVWLGINDDGKNKVDGVSQVGKLPQDLSKIAGTYNILYWAYKCKGDGQYNKGYFNDALTSYQSGHQYLLLASNNSIYWDEVKSFSLNNIALCYKNLSKYSVADSIFLEAIKVYKGNKNTRAPGLALIISNLAHSLSEETQFEQANKLYLVSNSVLRNDTINQENRNDLVSNYNSLAKNYLYQDSLNHARFYINKALNVSESKNLQNHCETLMYYGISYYKLNEFEKADSILKSCLTCYKDIPETKSQNIAECYLLFSHVNIALAKYDKAKTYLNKGMNLTQKNYGVSSSRYANYLKVQAYLNRITGNYQAAEEQYRTVMNIYNRELGSKNNKLPAVLSGLADLEVTLAKLDSAKKHSDRSIALASTLFPFTTPSTTDLLNEAAYVDYSLGLYKSAEVRYLKVIKTNQNFGLQASTTATSLNGMGLIETAKGNYPKADSLFQASLKIYRAIFSEAHPLTASVYLNLGDLNIQRGRLKEAEENISNALKINKLFFEDEHDIFGNIYVAFGDLAEKNKQQEVANRYFNRSLGIYLNKFDRKHWKVIKTKQKVEVFTTL